MCSFWGFLGLLHEVYSWMLPFFHILWLLVFTLTQFGFNLSLPVSRFVLPVAKNVSFPAGLPTAFAFCEKETSQLRVLFDI